MANDHTLKIGTASGTLLCLLQNDIFSDIVKTIILAATGATVSFVLTLFYRWLWEQKISRNNTRMPDVCRAFLYCSLKQP